MTDTRTPLDGLGHKARRGGTRAAQAVMPRRKAQGAASLGPVATVHGSPPPAPNPLMDLQQQPQQALAAARHEAAGARAASADAMAAASHALRQPLQTLTLLHGLLAKRVAGAAAEALVARLDQTVHAMSGMLHSLLDAHTAHAGTALAHPGLQPMAAPDQRHAHPPGLQTAQGHVIFVVDDDETVRDAVRTVLEDDGRTVEGFETGEAFLAAYTPGSDGCLLIDAAMPGMSGLEVLQHLRQQGDTLPSIMITGSSDVPMAVRAMRAGAADFIEKPIAAADLLSRIDRALERSQDTSKLLAWQAGAAAHIALLTPRQHQIMALVLAGQPSKNIAIDLGISQRTVENHRASIMRTMGTRSLPALARLAMAAAQMGDASGLDGG